jgi:fructose-1,6-bisphosphatase II / sedoheptulose-1,7-bisphosphatase
MYIGTGGAPEGVLAAAALQCIGGQMQGRLVFRNDAEKERAARAGITDLKKKYGMNDLAHGDVMFSASGVTNGAMLRGVRLIPGGALTHTVVMRSRTGTVRYIEAHHNFRRKPMMGQ